jgi:hypothetical protein
MIMPMITIAEKALTAAKNSKLGTMVKERLAQLAENSAKTANNAITGTSIVIGEAEEA